MSGGGRLSITTKPAKISPVSTISLSKLLASLTFNQLTNDK
jgi:hypothetical protein